MTDREHQIQSLLTQARMKREASRLALSVGCEIVAATLHGQAVTMERAADELMRHNVTPSADPLEAAKAAG